MLVSGGFFDGFGSLERFETGDPFGLLEILECPCSYMCSSCFSPVDKIKVIAKDGFYYQYIEEGSPSFLKVVRKIEQDDTRYFFFKLGNLYIK